MIGSFQYFHLKFCVTLWMFFILLTNLEVKLVQLLKTILPVCVVVLETIILLQLLLVLHPHSSPHFPSIQSYSFIPNHLHFHLHPLVPSSTSSSYNSKILLRQLCSSLLNLGISVSEWGRRLPESDVVTCMRRRRQTRASLKTTYAALVAPLCSSWGDTI